MPVVEGGEWMLVEYVSHCDDAMSVEWDVSWKRLLQGRGSVVNRPAGARWQIQQNGVRRRRGRRVGADGLGATCIGVGEWLQDGGHCLNKGQRWRGGGDGRGDRRLPIR